MAPLGLAPMMLFTGLPPWNTVMVGVDMTWESRAICGFSSMLSFAIVSLSRCSAAISSSTGATILHGPHHSAQKSTSTGLSLPRTSLAKLASVTVTVLPAMEVLLLDGYCWEDRASALVEGLGEPALGVDRRGGAGARRGDRLPVDVVDDVATGEHAVDVGAGGGVVDHDVALVVQLQLADEQLGARVVPDRHEDAADRQLLGRAGLDVGQLDAGDGGVAAHVGDLLAQLPADLLVVLRALLHDLGRAQLGTPVHHGDRLGEAGEEGRLLHRRVTAADHDDVLVAEEEAVTGGTGGHAAAEQALLVVQPEVAVLRAGGHDHRVRPVHLVADLDDLRGGGEVDLGDVTGDELGAEALGLRAHVVHELRALDALGEPGEVLDLGGRHQRATELRALEHQGVQVGARRIGGCGVPGRAGPDDDQVADPVVLRRGDGGRAVSRDRGTGGGLVVRHGRHNGQGRCGIPCRPGDRPGARRQDAATTATSARSAEKPSSTSTRPVTHTST